MFPSRLQNDFGSALLLLCGEKPDHPDSPEVCGSSAHCSDRIGEEPKKYDLQARQLQDTQKRETYKVYGELLQTYGYQADPESKELEALNYYTNEMIRIPLDPTKTPLENSKRYFEKYNKLKRTYEALSRLIVETKDEIIYLESISNALDIARTEDDLAEVKEELTQSGYVRRKFTKKKETFKSLPLHYRSSDGYDIYVGKNNFQNEELTFSFASGNDWWFHAKKCPDPM